LKTQEVLDFAKTVGSFDKNSMINIFNNLTNSVASFELAYGKMIGYLREDIDF